VTNPLSLRGKKRSWKMELGERIRRARDAQDASQADLAKELGKTAGAVSQWGKRRHEPGNRLPGGLSEFLGISLEELLGDGQRGTSVGAGTTKVDGTGIQLDVALLKEAGELGSICLQRSISNCASWSAGSGGNAGLRRTARRLPTPTCSSNAMVSGATASASSDAV
jgi:transcriptional regulator with XRE-family HTH domain